MAGYHVENFGCRASRADGEAIAANLRHIGLAPAEAPDSAQVVIVNTCSVTAEADRQARAYLRRARRQNPAARIVVTGCYAQRAPGELAALPEVDAVVGNSHKSLVAEIALQFGADAEVVIPAGTRPAPQTEGPAFLPLSSVVPRVLHDDTFAHSELAALPFAADAQQTRPNLKVQDGCGNRCSFCIVPTTRGPSRSVPLATCLDNARRFVDPNGNASARGGVELVLSGINLGRWGRDLQPVQRFEDLVAAILRSTSLPRLRLSSIEPMDWSPDLLSLYREYAADASLHPAPCTLHPVSHPVAHPAFHPRLARHAHLPLQSGSDTILRRMHRRYRPWHYAERLAAIRALLPDAAIGADVMIGFPGETDALFQESYDFIATQPFTYLHLFPFSARPGTPAWELHRRQPVPSRAVQERMAALRALIAEKSRAFRQRFLGRILSAVTMDTAPDGTTDAMSDNFLRLSLTRPNGTAIPGNRLVPARITALTPDGLAGIVEDPASIQ
ncbi:MAG: radical SAM protein [Acidobacteriaceae bacterium]